MDLALGSATSVLGKLLTTLSDGLVAAYVDSLELGHNSEQIKAKLLHTLGLLDNAQRSDIGHNRGLQGLLPALSRNADQAEDLLDEIQYFQIHDRLHGTNCATTQEAGPDRHVRSTVRHTVGSLLQCFSCSPTEDGADDSALADDPRGATNSASNSASADGDTLHFDRVSVSRRIKSVLQDMQTHCDSISDLLRSIPGRSTPVALYRPQIGSTIIQDSLYGRRDTFEGTVNRIMSCKQTVSVLPIVGPGGIGKTAFTQHLYNDARTEKHFVVRVWVCVSTDFDVLKLTREILGCILATEGGGSGANETTNLDQLQKSIAHRLKVKRFLIVLDDIWKCCSEDKWKTLLAPFTKGEAKGSMVLVTTRFPILAQMLKTTETLELAGLESNDFFRFFEECIFGEHKPEYYKYELAGIAGKIANKLKGSPLAAKTVGRLLQKDLSQEHWNGVLQKHEWLNLENNDDIMPSLKISYDHLPFYLKKRFPYFGLFPEDHRFASSEMKHFFVAIGITDSTHQGNRNYLDELVDNGFLMKGDDHGDEYYVLHDLMHELCRSVSMEECLNISGLDFRAVAIPQSVQHLSVTVEDRYDVNFEEEMCKLRGRIDIANLRTLMIFRRYEGRIAKLLKDCFKEINSLRVLFIAVNSPQCFPHRFSKLIHLQYLKISSSYGDREMRLPSTLSRFYHLKFLNLENWGGSSDLPEDFSHLENLHDFRVSNIKNDSSWELHSNIRNVGKIKHLQRLHVFCIKKESMGFELGELGPLTELEEELTICSLEHVATKEQASAAKLTLKRNLKGLILHCNRNRPTIEADILDAFRPGSDLRVLGIINCGGTTGPSWLCLDIWLTSLKTLTLDGVSWSTLPPFGKIPNLRVLNLKRISGMCQFRCGGAPGKCFLHLNTVMLLDMPELAEWVVESSCHSFASLEIIECVNCPNLHVMPFSEVSCINLRRLRVYGCPKMSLPSMPHTSTLTDLIVTGADVRLQTLRYDGKKLVVYEYIGSLAFHNLDKVEDLSCLDISHISLTDIKKLKTLRKLVVQGCDVLLPEELDDSIEFCSVASLTLDVSSLTCKSPSRVLKYFPALSVLEMVSSRKGSDCEECLMHLPSSSSLQTLSFSYCNGLVLVPLKNGGGIHENSLLHSLSTKGYNKFCRWPMAPLKNGGGIHEENSLLHSLSIRECNKFFCRWPMGEAGGLTIYPFPASLGKLHVESEPSMKSMALLSNLKSLTSLRLVDCNNLAVDGFNPLITVNLKELQVYSGSGNSRAADLLSEVARTKLLPADYISRLEKLVVDNISGLLVAPICSFLAPALHTLSFRSIKKKTESFTEEQEKALQLLTSLQNLEFNHCGGLQSLPQGLHLLSSLKELHVIYCLNIKSVPKEGFPVSLKTLQISHRSAELHEQIQKIKRANPNLSETGDIHLM